MYRSHITHAAAEKASTGGMVGSANVPRRRRNITPLVPGDILSLIFLACRDGDSEYLQCPRVSRTKGPLKLSWVSRRWRGLALSLTELWTGISLGIGKLTPSDAAVELLSTFISRSGPTLPLQFDLQYGHEQARSEVVGASAEAHIREMRRITQVISLTRRRWEAISLHALTLEALEDFFDCFNLGAPNLKYFQITTQSTIFRGQRCPLNFILCPNLQSVRIGCPRVCIEPEFSSCLSLGSMTSLDLSYSHSHLDGLTWLKCCPNLVYLSLWFYSASSDLDLLAHTPPITLPRLSRLSVSTYFVDGTGDPSLFLALLTLPALRELSLSMNNLVFVDRREGWHAVTELLQRSNVTTLRFLEIQGTPMRARELTEILHMQHELKELGIDGTLATKALFSELGGQDAQNRSLCPELETLHLRAYHGSADALADMVVKRCPSDDGSNPTPPKTLKKLVLMWCAGQSIMDHPKVKASISHGLKVVRTPSNLPFQRSFTAT